MDFLCAIINGSGTSLFLRRFVRPTIIITRRSKVMGAGLRGIALYIASNHGKNKRQHTQNSTSTEKTRVNYTKLEIKSSQTICK